MKTYLAEQLVAFLEAVDAALDESTEMVVIGGTAVALHYGVKHPTRDIDTWNVVSRSLAAAVDAARRRTGLDGDPWTVRGNFLGMVEVLFPDEIDSVIRRLRPRGR